jgi:hypothetical protein
MAVTFRTLVTTTCVEKHATKSAIINDSYVSKTLYTFSMSVRMLTAETDRWIWIKFRIGGLY